MKNIILAGDSVFDNASHVGSQLDVASHLRKIVLPDWTVSLIAIDGSTTEDVSKQMQISPNSNAHLILSIGGNDAMLQVKLLDFPVQSTAEALRLFCQMTADFEIQYGHAIDACERLRIPITICTIYHANFSDSDFQKRAVTALTLFNDAILRTAKSRRLNVIDLRDVCNSPRDFTKQIEPSAEGGRKIAEAIALAVHGRRPTENFRILNINQLTA